MAYHHPQQGYHQEAGPQGQLVKIFCKAEKTFNLAAGRRLSSFMTRGGLDSDTFLCDHLIRVFAACGQLLDASHAFTSVANPSIFTWNAILSAHANLGASARALEMYFGMRQNGFEPDVMTFLCVLKACSDLRVTCQGMAIHDHIVKSGHHMDSTVGNAILDMYYKAGILEDAQMYDKCGSLTKALQVFDKLPVLDVVSWTALITRFVDEGSDKDALKSFDRMQAQGFYVDIVLFTCILKAYGGLVATDRGREIHAWMEKIGLTTLEDQLIGNALVDMYGKCGLLLETQEMFDRLQLHGSESWNLLQDIKSMASHNALFL